MPPPSPTRGCDGAVEQLERILGPAPDGIDRANELLGRAVGPLGAVGTGPVRRHVVAAACPARRWATCSASATGCASSAATATSPRGWRPASTPPRSACSPSSTGACRPAPTSAPGPGATPQLDAAEARLHAAGHFADGDLTDAGPRARASRSSWPPTPSGPRHRRARRRPRGARRPPRGRGPQAVMDAGGYPPSPLAITRG